MQNKLIVKQNKLISHEPSLIEPQPQQAFEFPSSDPSFRVDQSGGVVGFSVQFKYVQLAIDSK